MAHHKKIVACVPNVSEGRNKAIIDEIARKIKNTQKVELLDVDSGHEAHRTVYTFAGELDAVGVAAYQVIQKAANLINMAKHKGAHARLGAVDVCPFIPVSGVTVSECIQLAEFVGRQTAENLGIPVYLYGHAAMQKERQDLPTIRKGEYEGLAAKLKDPGWRPDFGCSIFNPRSGATVIGVRETMVICFNVNLNTKNQHQANEIAINLRESGKPRKNEFGRSIMGPDGNPMRIPGKLKKTKALGWYIPEYGCAQISFNLIDYRVTPMHVVYEECVKEAAQKGLKVNGSEVVGLIPKSAILQAGLFYLLQTGQSVEIPEEKIIQSAVEVMGLNSVTPFSPKKKILEYRMGFSK